MIRLAVLLLFLASVAHAQIDKSFLVRKRFASPTNPSQIAGSAFWWVAEDNALGRVSAWPDRIQGSTWSNGDTAVQPTNTASGVQFWRNATTFLTNTVDISASTVSSHFLIFKLNRNTIQQSILNVSPSVNTRAIGIDPSPAGQLFIFVSPNSRNNGLLQSNTWYSVLITCSSAPQTVFYTNGIPSNTNNAGNLGSATWGSFGGNSGNGFLEAHVRELAIWTNTVLTGADAATLHAYAKVKYGL